jgi:hypothetical protein
MALDGGFLRAYKELKKKWEVEILGMMLCKDQDLISFKEIEEPRAKTKQKVLRRVFCLRVAHRG